MTHYDDNKESFRCEHGKVMGMGKCLACDPIPTTKIAAEFPTIASYATEPMYPDIPRLPPECRAILARLAAAEARCTELEAAIFSAGRLYGFETGDGLPCWCEPSDRSGPHSPRCAEIRNVLSPGGPQ